MSTSAKTMNSDATKNKVAMYVMITPEEAEALQAASAQSVTLAKLHQKYTAMCADSEFNSDKINKARRKYADPSNDAVEIDDHPPVSKSHDGIWISAWVHVRQS